MVVLGAGVVPTRKGCTSEFCPKHNLDKINFYSIVATVHHVFFITQLDNYIYCFFRQILFLKFALVLFKLIPLHDLLIMF